jgi:hypothetical protein
MIRLHQKIVQRLVQAEHGILVNDQQIIAAHLRNTCLRVPVAKSLVGSPHLVYRQTNLASGHIELGFIVGNGHETGKITDAVCQACLMTSQIYQTGEISLLRNNPLHGKKGCGYKQGNDTQAEDVTETKAQYGIFIQSCLPGKVRFG